MILYDESTPFLDVSAKLIFDIIPLMADAWLPDSCFPRMKGYQRIPNINQSPHRGNVALSI